MLICSDLRHKVHYQPMSHRVAVAKPMKWRPAARRLGARVRVVANLAK
jgi:hypothetical protein